MTATGHDGGDRDHATRDNSRRSREESRRSSRAGISVHRSSTRVLSRFHTCHIFDGSQPQLMESISKRAEGTWRLGVALGLSLFFMLAEIIAAYLSNSLALWSDSAHMLSDVSGFAISLIAASLATRGPSATHSFGFLRLEVLGALGSIMLIWGVTGILVYEAGRRIRHPEDVDGRTMVIIGCLGLLSNATIAWVVGHDHDHHHGHSHSHGPSRVESRNGANGDVEAPLLSASARSNGRDDHHHDHDHDHDHDHGQGSVNQRAAFIHALGDAIQNIGVIIAGLVIWMHPGSKQWALADPACTFLFSVLVLFTTSGVLREVGDVLMERVPRDTEVDGVKEALLSVEGVDGVHDFHLWQLSAGIPLLSCHVLRAPGADFRDVLARTEAVLHSRGILHTTIQVEDADLCHHCGASSHLCEDHGDS